MTVPVVLAVALWKGRDVVEGLGLDIKGSSKTLEYNGRSQPLEDSVAGHYCVTLSPERYASLLKLKNSPDPPSHTSYAALDQKNLLLLKKSPVKKCLLGLVPRRRRLQKVQRTVVAGSWREKHAYKKVLRTRTPIRAVCWNLPRRRMTTSSSYFSVQSGDELNISKNT